MLDALNRVDVSAGDVLFVPAGTAHAIGEGVLLVELQEPSDLSILLEWRGFASGEDEASLGLGWDVALECVDRAADRRRPACSPVGSLADADPFFRAERIDGSQPAELDRGFAILVLTEGAGELRVEDGEPLPVGRGDTVLVPWDAGPWRLEGDVVGVACRPPAVDAGGRRDRPPARHRRGTSACKAAVVDADGRRARPRPIAARPGNASPTGAEIDPEALFEAAVGAAHGALAGAPDGQGRAPSA